MPSKVKKLHLLLLAVNILAICGFGTVFVTRRNYEFSIYVAAIIVFLILIAASWFRVPYTDATVVSLTVWAILHMAGGAIYLNGVRLYEIMLVRVSSAYPIFRYDQFVHIWGFGAATLTMFCILMPILRKDLDRYVSLSIIVIMAGLGVGAFNEIVEALVAAAIKESGVGGYVNTALDLIADFIGAILGMIYTRLRYVTH